MQVPETQSRIVYSLLKPAVRAAAHFGVPIRTVADLVRLAYFEELRDRGLSNTQIAAVFGQSDRHMRNLASRLESDFFSAEREVGLVRQVEAFVASADPTREDVLAEFATSGDDAGAAVDALLAEHRIELADGARLRTAQRYVALKTEGFSARVDAINHFLDGGYRAVLHRLVFNDDRLATLKTISFSAFAHELQQVWAGLEGSLRRDLAELDESACFGGNAGERYTIAIALAPIIEEEEE